MINLFGKYFRVVEMDLGGGLFIGIGKMGDDEKLGRGMLGIKG